MLPHSKYVPASIAEILRCEKDFCPEDAFKSNSAHPVYASLATMTVYFPWLEFQPRPLNSKTVPTTNWGKEKKNPSRHQLRNARNSSRS